MLGLTAVTKKCLTDVKDTKKDCYWKDPIFSMNTVPKILTYFQVRVEYFSGNCL